MRNAASALIAFSGEVFAHPGHGGQEGHFHGLGIEHALLFVVIAGLLAFAARK